MTQADESPEPSRSTPVKAHRLLFPLAALYGAGVVPLWALAYAGYLPSWQPPAFWHGHEMLFGFALAVVGGYLLTQATRRGLIVAIGLWGLGRAAAALPELPMPIAVAAALAYPVCLFLLAGLPLLRAAKRWRNLVFAPILAAFVLAELVFQAGSAGEVGAGEMRGLALALGVVALLLFVMGGRVMAAACSGAWQRAGASHRDMAQGRVEAAGVASLALAAIAGLFGASLPAALAAVVAGTLAAARLLRWRPWALRQQREIALLGLGYGWLAAGLVLAALAALPASMAWADALHGLGAGALGTLAATMMMRVALQRARRPVILSAAGVTAVALVSLATAARLAVIWCEAWRLPLLELAAALWCGAFLIVFVELLRAQPRSGLPPAAGR